MSNYCTACTMQMATEVVASILLLAGVVMWDAPLGVRLALSWWAFREMFSVATELHYADGCEHNSF